MAHLKTLDRLTPAVIVVVGIIAVLVSALSYLLATTLESPGIAVLILTLLNLAGVFIAASLLRMREAEGAGSFEPSPGDAAIDSSLLTSTQLSKDIILLIAMDGTIITASEGAAGAYGYVTRELQGMNLRDVRAPETLGDMEVQMKTVREMGGMRFETIHRRRDGHKFPVETSSRLIELDGHQYFLAVIRDITQRKSDELRLTRLNDCFLSFGSDPVRNINALVSLCGESLGAASALYNRLDGELLCSIGQWNTPRDVKTEESRHGHICNDVIEARNGGLLVVRDLQSTSYATSDPNVKKYNLQTYIGHAVRFGEENIGSLCAVFQHDVAPTPDDLKLIGILASAIGVEENRRHKEQALLESEDRYRLLVEFSPDAIAVHLGGKIVYVNRAGLQLIGANEMGELVGKPILEIVHPDDREVVRARAFQTPGAEHAQPFLEERFVRLDGSVVDVEVAATPILYEGGQATLVVARDLADRKKAQAELVKLRKAVESSGEIIFTTDPDGIMTFINPEFTAVYGFEPDEVVGKATPRILKSGLLEDRDYEMFWKSLLQRQIVKGELTNRTKDGRLITVEGSASPILGDKGTIIGFLAIQRDITERKRVQDALRSSEASYRELFNSVDDAIYIQDKEGVFLDVNQGAVAMYGYPREFFIGKTPEFLSAPGANDMKKTADAVRKTFEGEPQRFEWWGRRSNGECFPKEVRLNRSFYFGQEVVVALAQDITERRAAVQRLSESEEKFRTLSEQSPNMIYINRAGKVVYVNQRCVELMGYSKDEFYSPDFSFLSLITPEHIAAVKGNYRRHMAGEEVAPYEYILLTKDGKKVLGIHTTRLINYEGSSAILGIVTDVTESRSAELEIRKLHRAVEQSPSAILITDINGTIEYVNPKFTEVTGFSEEEAIGQNPSILKSGHTPDEEYKNLWETILVGKEWRGEFRNKKKNGELFWELASISAIRDPAGAITHFLAVKEDVTERKVLEQQLRQAQKMESIGTLASGIAHDFNNILGIILGYASLLDQKSGDAARLAAYTDAIVKAAERGAGLVRQILTFARKSDFTLERVNVNSVIGELAKMLGETFPKTITLSLQLEKALPLLSVDRTQVHQALLNLCVNARDAMADRGALTISTSLIGGEVLARRFPTASGRSFVEISVADTGKGMDEKTRERVFEPFFTTKEVGKGTGLGLAVVFGVVQEHQGFIDVESEVELGSTFRIWLPVPIGLLTTVEGRSLDSIDVRGGTETVLVVEDEVLMLGLVVSVLEQKGYVVIAARDGEDAVRVYEEQRGKIALVLSDLGLPKLDGWTACKKMRQSDPTLRVLIASGYLESGLKAEILKERATGLIRKPYSPNEILFSVREALDAR